MVPSVLMSAAEKMRKTANERLNKSFGDDNKPEKPEGKK
jgi:hypothetical protein